MSLSRSLEWPIAHRVSCQPRLTAHSKLSLRFKGCGQPRSIIRGFTTFNDAFVGALVRASTCTAHRRPAHDRGRPLEKAPTLSTYPGRRRHYAMNAGANPAPAYTLSQNELQDLVDVFGFGNSTSSKSPAKSRRVENEPPMQGLLAFANSEFNKKTKYRAVLKKLEEMLKDKSTPHQDLLEVYNRLPEPRALHVPRHVMNDLMHTLSVLERKTESAMLRYLALIGDIKAIGRPLTRSQWTTAMSMAGRWSKNVTDSNVDAALRTWKEMESEAGIQANKTTFNVLFDVATKAGKFALADMIYREMQHRNLDFDRFFRTGLIYYHGLRRDGQEVRKAYRELVESGEFVDTAVISCVIAAMLNCGEPSAAEQTFEKAKRLHSHKFGTKMPSFSWQEKREMGRLLAQAATKAQGNEDLHQQIQQSAPLAPNAQTYKILVKYYAVVIGDIDRVTALLSEMQHFSLAPSGSIYLYLFKGFTAHGGVLYSSWTRRRLEGIYSAFQEAVDDPKQHCHISRPMATLCLAAFAKCTDNERTLEVMDEIRARWPAEQGPVPSLADLDVALAPESIV